MGFVIQHFLNEKSKQKIKHLKDPGNQKAFKGMPKENKNCTKRSCKKKQKQKRKIQDILNIIRKTEEKI